jgi:parvulin-like peptidyl-prolyl isomerase
MNALRTHPRGLTLTAAAVICGATLGTLPTPARAQDGDAVVIVNGHPISKRRMTDLLMEAHGLQLMQQLIVLELAQEETAKRKIKVSAADVEREYNEAVAKIAPQTNATGQPLTDDERRQALEYLLQEKGLSMTEFKIGMERNAHLRKLVEADLKIDDAVLREEFGRLYGEKVEVRALQVADTNSLHEALNQLEKGADFAALAQRISQDPPTAQRGGLMDAFAFNDDAVAPVLREAAFALKRAGERTQPIRVGRWWFILQFERRVPPSDVQFDNVRTEVAAKLKERVVPAEMNRLVAETFRKAEIRVLDSKLKPRFEELMKNNPVVDAATKP